MEWIKFGSVVCVQSAAVSKTRAAEYDDVFCDTYSCVYFLAYANNSWLSCRHVMMQYTSLLEELQLVAKLGKIRSVEKPHKIAKVDKLACWTFPPTSTQVSPPPPTPSSCPTTEE